MRRLSFGRHSWPPGQRLKGKVSRWRCAGVTLSDALKQARILVLLQVYEYARARALVLQALNGRLALVIVRALCRVRPSGKRIPRPKWHGRVRQLLVHALLSPTSWSEDRGWRLPSDVCQDRLTWQRSPLHEPQFGGSSRLGCSWGRAVDQRGKPGRCA